MSEHDEVVEAMARGIMAKRYPGLPPERMRGLPMRLALEEARAAIRALPPGWVVAKVPEDNPPPDETRDWLDKSHGAKQWRRALVISHNAALATYRASAEQPHE